MSDDNLVGYLLNALDADSQREVEAQSVSERDTKGEAPVLARCGDAPNCLLTGVWQGQSFLIGTRHSTLWRPKRGNKMLDAAAVHVDSSKVRCGRKPDARPSSNR